jgi:hypothetical protein
MDLKNSLISRLGFSVFALGLGALGVLLIGLALLGLGDGLAQLVGAQTAAHVLNAATVAYPVFVVILAFFRMADVASGPRDLCGGPDDGLCNDDRHAFAADRAPYDQSGQPCCG